MPAHLSFFCTNAIELRDVGKYLSKIRCKWNKEISNMIGTGEVGVEL
jgi:hypothetical protein